MNANRKRNDALNIADFTIDDILSTPGDQLLAEVAEDYGDHEALAAEFDAIAFPVLSQHSEGVVGHGDPAAPAQRPVPFARSSPGASRAFLQAALVRLSEWTGASLRPRFALGALATLLLVAILSPALYPLLIEHATDSGALQPNSPARKLEAEGRTPRAMPAERSTSDPKDRIDQINRFVDAYDGGDCFFATPVLVAEHQATLESYGSAVAPFEKLGNEFKRNFGFEAFIRAHRVTPAQCGAVNFLSRMRNQRGPVPSLDVGGGTTLHSGETLTGTIADFGNREVALLLVANDGSVRNLTNTLRTTGNGRSFSIPVQKSSSERAEPDLLLAIAASKPLDALTRVPLGSADQVFGRVLAEVERDGQAVSVSAKFFTLEQ
jgi:hypothetical protein